MHRQVELADNGFNLLLDIPSAAGINRRLQQGQLPDASFIEMLAGLFLVGVDAAALFCQAFFNYIVDDLDALLGRLKREGVKIDAKRMDESYGRFAWIYDVDGNKIELWQPTAKP